MKANAFVFFLDRNLGTKQVAEALRQAGAIVEIHNDYFLPDANDEEWLPEVGKRGWIVLTKDDRIRYRTRVVTIKGTKTYAKHSQPIPRC
jgi:uncharacterized protein with PIN domain